MRFPFSLFSNPLLNHSRLSPLQVGTLIIDYARKQHSGNYSCAPSNSAPVQVTLHVINGSYNLINFNMTFIEFPSLSPSIHCECFTSNRRLVVEREKDKLCLFIFIFIPCPILTVCLLSCHFHSLLLPPACLPTPGESSASAVTSACSPSLGIYGNIVPFVLSFFLLIQTWHAMSQQIANSML